MDPSIKLVSIPPTTTRNDQDDVVIVFMGLSGAGKSSFIKFITGDTSIKISSGLLSASMGLQIIHFRDRNSGRKVTFVDTPGFGDPRAFDDSPGPDDSCPKFTDTDILKMIVDFLLREYDLNRKLSGLIYVQRISDFRFCGQSAQSLRIFQELCGPAAYKNVVILTTFWDEVPTDVGVMREEQLESRFFAKLAERGAQFMRHDHTVESTRKVLQHFLSIRPTVTQIQTEIRKEGKSLTETAAGSVCREDVEIVLAHCKKEIPELTAEIATVKKSNKTVRQKLEMELAGLRNLLAVHERERERGQAALRKGLDEERDLRKRLETNADELHTQFLQQIQSLSKEEKAKKLRKFQATTREAIDHALREARKNVHGPA